MKYQKIVLARGNGYLGRVLAKYYSPLAAQVIVLSRKAAVENWNTQTVVWDVETPGRWSAVLEGADLLINLCGKNVNCRYNEANKKEIISSRVVPTGLLGEVITGLLNPPKLWINITSATIYRHAEDCVQDEETGQIGYGFSIDVCRAWEESFFATQTPGTRKIALRMSIVLGRQDGAFPRLLNLVKIGLGGKQGDGNQYVSWIHEQDAASCTEFLLAHDELDGVFNCTAPQPITNKVLMQTIREGYGIPFGLPSPAWLLEIGARVIGTETELILKSRWVMPKKLLDSGFTFMFPTLGPAIKDIISISA
jgi:uncharacterized protein (TIGR01777 family)